MYKKIGDFQGVIERDDSDDNKVLGVRWNKYDDQLCLKFNDIGNKCVKAVTKLEVLYCIASIYDPFGMINPIVAKVKCLNLCVAKQTWDEPLCDELLQEWQTYVITFKKAVILDMIDVIQFVDVQLHGLSDVYKSLWSMCLYKN